MRDVKEMWVKHGGGGYSLIQASFGLESGMVLEGITGVHEHLSGLNSKWIRKKWDFLGSEIGLGFGETGGTPKTKSTSRAISHGDFLKTYQTVDREN